MRKVVFACVHNAGRSQMAAAWFNALAPRTGSRDRERAAAPWAVSAGTDPADRLHPEVLEVMKEVGVDLSSARPQRLTTELVEDADLLITMGCGDRCPYVPGLQTEDWPLEDPKGKPLPRVRGIRDEIRRRVEALLARE